METLRFLMVTTHYPPFNIGGDGVMVEDLSKELVRRGHDVDVFFSPTVYTTLRKRRPNTPPKAIESGPIVHPFAPKAGYANLLLTLAFNWDGKANKRLRDLIRSVKPDVVHWHDTKGFIGVPFAIPGVTTLYTAHDYLFVCPRSNLAKPDMSFCRSPGWCTFCTVLCGKPPQLWRMGALRVLRLEEDIKVLAPSQFMAKRLRQDGIEVYDVLNNFVPDPGRLAPVETRMRNSIAYVGMLERHKGSPTLLEAFARCRNQQGFKLHIIGEGSLKEKLRRRAKALGLSDRVEVPGFIPRADLEYIVRRSAAVVVPSEWPETASLAAIEALSFGVPVLASNQGGLPETVGDDSSSMLFRAGDVEELAEDIVKIWNRMADLDELSRNARGAYERRLSPETHLAHYMMIISRLRKETAEKAGAKGG